MFKPAVTKCQPRGDGFDPSYIPLIIKFIHMFEAFYYTKTRCAIIKVTLAFQNPLKFIISGE